MKTINIRITMHEDPITGISYKTEMQHGQYVKHLSGRQDFDCRTSRRVEMKAVNEALSLIKEPAKVIIYNQEPYTRTVNKYGRDWQKAQYKRPNNGGVYANQDLIDTYIGLVDGKHLDMEFHESYNAVYNDEFMARVANK